MATAKKKTVKVRDLKPAKDAKGGMRITQDKASKSQNTNRGNTNVVRNFN